MIWRAGRRGQRKSCQPHQAADCEVTEALWYVNTFVEQYVLCAWSRLLFVNNGVLHGWATCTTGLVMV